MSAIYERQKTTFGGSFSSDVAALTIAGTLTSLGIVQNVALNFAQNVSRIYDVANGGLAPVVPVFYVGGRTNGNLSIARVLGPQSGALCEFYARVGNVCLPQDFTFTFQGGCNVDGSIATINNAVGPAGSNRVQYSVEDAVMVNLGVSINSNDMIVNENVQMIYANLDCEG